MYHTRGIFALVSRHGAVLCHELACCRSGNVFVGGTVFHILDQKNRWSERYGLSAWTGILHACAARHLRKATTLRPHPQSHLHLFSPSSGRAHLHTPLIKKSKNLILTKCPLNSTDPLPIFYPSINPGPRPSSATTLPQTLLTFFALYLTTLFSLDTWNAARSSPYRSTTTENLTRPSNPPPARDSYQGGMHGQGRHGYGSGGSGGGNVARLPQSRDSRVPLRMGASAGCGGCMM